MLTEIQIYTLAIIQGITEFLPISSSGHLVLTSQLLGWPDQGLLLDVAVHLGTLGAVLLFLRKDIWNMLIGLYMMIKGRSHSGQKLILLLIMGTLPLVAIGYFAKDYIYLVRSPEIIAYATIGFAILLWMIDRMSMTVVYVKHLSVFSAIFIGFMQCFALIPGTSRSGITITAARFLGMNRQEAARFSMLLSIPAIIASATLLGWDIYKENGAIIITQEILYAMGLSFVAALLFIAFMMAWVKNASFGIFVIYRIILGVLLLIWIHYGSQSLSTIMDPPTSEIVIETQPIPHSNEQTVMDPALETIHIENADTSKTETKNHTTK